MKFLKSLCGLIPILIFLGLQVGISALFMFGCMVVMIVQNPESASDSVALMTQLQAAVKSMTTPMMFVIELLSILIFGLWYMLAFVRKAEKKNPLRFISVNSILAVLFGSVALFFLSQFLVMIVSVISPATLDSYNKMLEKSGVVSGAFGLIIAILIAPVAEELVLRGVTYRLYKWAGIATIGCVIAQAVLFSLMHINPLQCLYTFPVGLVLGYLAVRYDTIGISILGHICYNFNGTIISTAITKLGWPSWVQWVIAPLVAIVGLALMILFVEKDKKADGPKMFEKHTTIDVANSEETASNFV